MSSPDAQVVHLLTDNTQHTTSLLDLIIECILSERINTEPLCLCLSLSILILHSSLSLSERLRAVDLLLRLPSVPQDVLVSVVLSAPWRCRRDGGGPFTQQRPLSSGREVWRSSWRRRTISRYWKSFSQETEQHGQQVRQWSSSAAMNYSTIASNSTTVTDAGRNWCLFFITFLAQSVLKSCHIHKQWWRHLVVETSIICRCCWDAVLTE